MALKRFEFQGEIKDCICESCLNKDGLNCTFFGRKRNDDDIFERIKKDTCEGHNKK